MESVRKYAWCFALGGVLALAGWPIWSWQFYAAGLPIVFLVAWSEER